jgi:hypothetical protein
MFDEVNSLLIFFAMPCALFSNRSAYLLLQVELLRKQLAEARTQLKRVEGDTARTTQEIE